MRVLIVDDHAPFRALARMLLVLDGFDVVGEAGDGAAALVATRDLHPDVVLLDVQLPDLNGFEVATVICRNGSATAVVLVSSRSRSDYGIRPQQHAARGFIDKAELSGAALRLVLGDK